VGDNAKMPLKIRQYAYFAINSEVLTAEDIAGSIGLEPDSTMVKGGRISDPPRPSYHSWRIECAAPNLSVDDLIVAVLSRLEPFRDKLMALSRHLTELQGDTGMFMRVVRYLDDEEGLADGWQHQLLGFAIEPEQLRFLADLNATIDVDEYGLRDDSDEDE
jgi:hypothetical protein